MNGLIVLIIIVVSTIGLMILGWLMYFLGKYLLSYEKFSANEECFYRLSDECIYKVVIEQVVGRRYLIKDKNYGYIMVWGYQLIKKEKEND